MPRIRQKHIAGWILLGCLSGAALTCSNAEKPVTVLPSLPRDPAHCTFEVPPTHETAAIVKGAVRAGLGRAILPVPIGAPLGGYGGRLLALGGQAIDARPPRFVTAFYPSVGLHDAPRAEAVALEAGSERVVIVRIDSVLVTENSLFELESAIAPDGSMRGRVLMTASHTHAGWAGWQASLVLMPGLDRPRKDLSDRVIGAMAKAAKDALASLEPAKIGFGIEPDFDPGDTVSHDRRSENDDVLGPDGNTAGKDKDTAAWAMRLDRADGSPMAAIVNVPVHGTVGGESNPLASTDTPGAIERALSAELGYPVLHLQGAAGDISPSAPGGRQNCPDAARCLDMPALEVFGARAAALLKPLVQGIQTSDSAAMEVVIRTVYTGRNATVHRPDGTELHYAPYQPGYEPDGIILDEQGRAVSPIDEFNTEAGAGLCGDLNAGSVAPIPGTTGLGAYSSCLDLTKGKDIVFGLFDILDDGPLPFCDTVRTTVTAIRVSGAPPSDVLLLSAPGEPTSPFAAYLRSRSPAGSGQTLLIGYTNEHAGYLLTAEDWLAGGYEPSTNIWGPLEGEMIIDGIVEAANIAWTAEHEDPEVGSSRFVDWSFPETNPVEPMVTTDHGTVAMAAPSMVWPDTIDPNAVLVAPSVARGVGVARFAWFGGDPAIDFPEVLIERETAPGVFEPLTDAHGRNATSYDGAVVVTYAPDPLEAEVPAHHIYAATWQPVPADPYSLTQPLQPYSLPMGRYRFRALGAAMSASGPTTYEVTSAPFDVTAAPLSVASFAMKQGADLQMTAILGNAPGLRALRQGVSDVDVPLPGPWTVVVSFTNLPDKTMTVMPDATGVGTAVLTAAEVAEAISVDVRDEMGNGGILTL